MLLRLAPPQRPPRRSARSGAPGAAVVAGIPRVAARARTRAEPGAAGRSRLAHNLPATARRPVGSRPPARPPRAGRSPQARGGIPTGAGGRHRWVAHPSSAVAGAPSARSDRPRVVAAPVRPTGSGRAVRGRAPARPRNVGAGPRAAGRPVPLPARPARRADRVRSSRCRPFVRDGAGPSCSGRARTTPVPDGSARWFTPLAVFRSSSRRGRPRRTARRTRRAGQSRRPRRDTATPHSFAPAVQYRSGALRRAIVEQLMNPLVRDPQ